MAYALVSAGSVATGTASVSPAFGASPTANNLLILLVGSNSFGCSNITGWIRDVGATTSPVNIFHRVAAGGDTAPSVVGSGNTFMVAVLAEFSGNATTLPFDQGASGVGGSSSPSALANPAADAAAGEVFVAVQKDVLSKAGTTTTSHSFNNGATANNLGNNDATSVVDHYRFSYGFTTGNSVADSVTASDASMNLSSINLGICSFKLAAAAPADYVPPSHYYRHAVERRARWFRRGDGLVIPRRSIFVPA